ncbi:MAG: hypothetical protein ACRDZU_15185 [Acidimicrobiales bacterium]
MTDATDQERDPRKVRLGLAIICGVVLIAVGAFFAISAALGKALMFAIAATAFVRAYLLVRWLKRSEDQGGP